MMNNSAVKTAHLSLIGFPASHDFNSPHDVGVEFVIRHVVKVVVPVVVDKVRHGRTRVANKFIRYAPHLAKCAVDYPAAQVGAHEKHAVIDLLENRTKAALSKREVGCRDLGSFLCLSCRFLAVLELGDIEVGQQAPTIRQRLNLMMNNSAIEATYFSLG